MIKGISENFDVRYMHDPIIEDDIIRNNWSKIYGSIGYAVIHCHNFLSRDKSHKYSDVANA